MKSKAMMLVGLFALVMISCGEKEALIDTKSNSLVDITSQDQFNSELKEGVSMVFYHASWCSKCAEQRPAVEEVSEEANFIDVFFAEVEYEDFSDIVEARGVNGFPTIVIYKDDVEQKKFSGKGHSAEEIRKALQEANM